MSFTEWRFVPDENQPSKRARSIARTWLCSVTQSSRCTSSTGIPLGRWSISCRRGWQRCSRCHRRTWRTLCQGQRHALSLLLKVTAMNRTARTSTARHEITHNQAKRFDKPNLFANLSCVLSCYSTSHRVHYNVTWCIKTMIPRPTPKSCMLYVSLYAMNENKTRRRAKRQR